MPSTPEIEAYSAEADRFIAELDEEYYQHYAGLKDRLELEEIYERHAKLMELENVQAVGAAVDGDRRVRELWQFGCEGYLGKFTREHAEKLAELEAELEVTSTASKVPYRMIRPEMANEADRGRREQLDRAMWEATEEHLNPVYLDGVEIVQRELPSLGVQTYVELYERFGFRLQELAAQCEAFLADTEQLYEERHRPRLARRCSGSRSTTSSAGTCSACCARRSGTRASRASRWCPRCGRRSPTSGSTSTASENIKLDIEQRPQKTPRAFCSPIEVPDKVMLVIQPIGGADDWRAFFHEAGHAEHFGNTSRDLAMEEKRLGDTAVTEGWAMLMQHLTDEPGWLSRKLDFPRPDEYAAEGMLWLLFFVRRYSAKLLYELEFHSADDLSGMPKRYAELLGDALKFEISEANYLADIDSGFYVTAYLRSWAFESQLRDNLRERFGNDWFAQREAGSLLRELWSLGQQPTADELLKDVTGAEIQMSAVGDRVREHLS